MGGGGGLTRHTSMHLGQVRGSCSGSYVRARRPHHNARLCRPARPCAGELAGRMSTALRPLQMRSPTGMLLWAALRVVYAPAFYFAASQGAGEAWMSVLSFTLGASNGYFTCCMLLRCALCAVRGRPAACGCAQRVCFRHLMAYAPCQRA